MGRVFDDPPTTLRLVETAGYYHDAEGREWQWELKHLHDELQVRRSEVNEPRSRFYWTVGEWSRRGKPPYPELIAATYDICRALDLDLEIPEDDEVSSEVADLLRRAADLLEERAVAS